MGKFQNDYFELLERQVAFSVQASALLSDILIHHTPQSIAARREEMHTIEHIADEQRHNILRKLSKEFITPIDQEDILRLVQIIDDVTDALDEVVIDLYMFNIDVAPQSAIDFSQIVNRCVNALQRAICELRNFKKSDKIEGLLVAVNDIESEADTAYIAAIHEISITDCNVKNYIGVKAIYDSLEQCCDLCENATDVIEQIIMKNL